MVWQTAPMKFLCDALMIGYKFERLIIDPLVDLEGLRMARRPDPTAGGIGPPTTTGGDGLTIC